MTVGTAAPFISSEPAATLTSTGTGSTPFASSFQPLFPIFFCPLFCGHASSASSSLPPIKSFMSNLQTVVKWQPWKNGTVKTGPGCWAYPDMLEVGFLASDAEDRTHFAAWCVVSSPLVLGHNISDQTQTSKIWPIVTNKQAIDVNQKFAGHPGGLVTSWNLNPDTHVGSTGACFIFFYFFLQSSQIGRIRRPHTILGEASAQQHSRDFDHQQQFVAGTRRARRLVPCRHALLSLASMRCSRYLARQGPAFQSLRLVVRSYAIISISYSHFIVRFKTGKIPPHDSKFYTVSLD